MMDQYTILAQYYDQLTTDVQYEKWADYIQRQFDRHKQPVHSVVELACGTGSLARLLALRGYDVTAVDISPDMLSVAAEKCEGLDVLFLCQDMAKLALVEPADAVVCCLDSVNYVTRPAPLQKAFRRVWQALAPGGLFLFDAKTPQALEEADGQVYLDENDGLYCVWRGEYDPRRRICGFGIDLFALQPDGSWDRGGEYHEEFAYTPEELTSYLENAGFSHIKQFGELKMTPPKGGDYRIFFAARKDL